MRCGSTPTSSAIVYTPRPGRQTCVAALVALALASGCALQKAEETEERTQALPAGQFVKVTTRNGSVTIGTGAPGKVKVKAIKRARASSSPEALLKEIKVTVSPRADGVAIAAEHPEGGLSKQYGVSFEITVPPGTPVSVESRNGSVRVSGTGAKVRAETRNGAVKVIDARHEARLTTRNGSIDLSGSPARFHLESGNGSIRVTLDAATSLAGASSATTKNGSITVTAPASFQGRIDAETVNGRVRSDFPMRGEAPSGSPTLRLRTRNGAIRIRKP